MSVLSDGGQVTDALNGRLTFEQSKNRIVGRDENNVARLLILAEANDFLMKISRDNIDVFTAENSQLIFNSNNNLFKIVSTGTVAVPDATASYSNSQSTSSTQTVINHGLGFVPAIIAFLVVDGTYFSLPTSGTGIINSTIGNWTAFQRNYLTDANRVVFTNTATVSGTGSGSYTISGYTARYYLLQETAA